MEQQAREQAFVTAVQTEHFTLQSARNAVISEMTGRGTAYLAAVSSALIAFGFIAQVAGPLNPFVAAILPAIFVLGEFTFVALLRNTMENIVYLRQIERIHHYYQALTPEAERFFGPEAQDWLVAARATIGLERSPFETLLTGASVVAAVNSILAGVGLALLAHVVGGLPTAALVTVGVAGALLLFGLHVLYGHRRIAWLKLAYTGAESVKNRTGSPPPRG
jgi:hypothetical protein